MWRAAACSEINGVVGSVSGSVQSSRWGDPDLITSLVGGAPKAKGGQGLTITDTGQGPASEECLGCSSICLQ